MEIPKEIMGKILLFNSHPAADLIRESIQNKLAWEDGYNYCECEKVQHLLVFILVVLVLTFTLMNIWMNNI